ncbi:MAG TPA: type II secretion system protein [Patescibacteria group bacterium]|jgi:general secretion pathway protein G|nr:type II secretion system protein [Patescibacteria group bacterium]
MEKRNHTSGFTLLELLVTATIIAVLTVIGVVSYSAVNKRSRDVKRKSDLEQIRSALEMYRSDYAAYPAVGSGNWNSASGLDTGDKTTGLVNSYLPAVPVDPLGSSATYYYKAETLSGSSYYGYCVCGCLEATAACDGTNSTNLISNSCDPSDLNQNCNYYLKNP